MLVSAPRAKIVRVELSKTGSSSSPRNACSEYRRKHVWKESEDVDSHEISPFEQQAAHYFFAGSGFGPRTIGRPFLARMASALARPFA